MVHDRFGRRLRIAPYNKMRGIGGGTGDPRMHGCPRRCTGGCSSLSTSKPLPAAFPIPLLGVRFPRLYSSLPAAFPIPLLGVRFPRLYSSLPAAFPIPLLGVRFPRLRTSLLVTASYVHRNNDMSNEQYKALQSSIWKVLV